MNQTMWKNMISQLQVEHKMFFIVTIMWLHVLHIYNTVKTVVLIMYH